MDTKIKLTYYDLEDNLAVENVWAVKEGNYYRIKNAPFYAPNLAYDDLVSIEEDEGELHFDELIETSGHSTVQVIIYKEQDVAEITRNIEDLKCNWEGSHLKTYISIDVPSHIDYKLIRNFLLSGRNTERFDFQEACLSEKHDADMEA